MKPLILSISILDTLGYADEKSNKKTKDKASCDDIEFSTDVTQESITQNDIKF
ncbi:MAG: hypothetical protein JEZ08_02465 [Clostridiales bacterium]|nr:hypothetical protein [Clostridiales bacterium]